MTTDTKGFRVSVAPAVEPVTVAEAKAHLRVTHNLDDTYIESLITAARQHVENATHRALITQTCVMTLDAFPVAPAAIELYRPRLIAVSSIAYIDSAGATKTWSSSDYVVDTQAEPGRVFPAYGEVYPTTQDRRAAVTITYTAGYGAAATAVPAAIKQAMFLLLRHWYDNRSAVALGTISTPVDHAVDALLAPYWMPNPEGY